MKTNAQLDSSAPTLANTMLVDGSFVGQTETLAFYNKCGNTFQKLPESYFYVRCENFQCVKIVKFDKKIEIWDKVFVIHKQGKKFIVSEYLTGLYIYETENIEGIFERVELLLQEKFITKTDFLWSIYAKPQINDESNHYSLNSTGINGTPNWHIYK
jgi:hypothetical protein